MRFKNYFYLSAAFAFALLSCSESDDLGGDFKPTTYDVLGKVEKGPFVSGSTITIQPMDADLQALGGLYSSTIQDDLGSFSFGSKSFEAPYAELTANGYFFNEVEGELSSGTLNLRALVDLSDETTVNVNLLTHLKYQRVQKLIAGGMKFGEANKQAQKELFTTFGLQKYAEKDASTFSIAGGTDESAALIAISSLLLADRSEAALTEYLAKLCREFGENGTFSPEMKQQMNEDKEVIWNELASVRENIVERYKSLGHEVEVKELERFIDWDNDGIAGNEVLPEGGEIELETTALHVPNQGGVYTVKITSPVPVYLEPQLGPGIPDSGVTEENFFTEIYDVVADDGISMENTLTGNVLTIKIDPLDSKKPKTAGITLYDGLSNVVGNITITQEGNGDTSIPGLGRTGKQVVSAIAMRLAQGFAELNLVEQYYHYNRETDWVRQNIAPNTSVIGNIWGNFHNANYMMMTFKRAEAEQLSVYQEYLDVFSAMQYYNMVVAWGDVPYVNFVPDYSQLAFPRTPQDEILTDLKRNLEKAIDYLEEKRNESLGNDVDDFFFLSKDVARILLADVYMYQGDYSQAEQLLKKVIANGFYTLDASNYNNKETITDLFDNGSSPETIFAVRYDNGDLGTRSNIFVGTPKLVPVMTYTDVVLSYAECLYKNGVIPEAEKRLSEVVTVKGINVSGSNVLEKIKSARTQLTLYTNTNFAFMKRNNFAQDVYGVEAYRTLLPIPIHELETNPSMIQNPGY